MMRNMLLNVRDELLTLLYRLPQLPIVHFSRFDVLTPFPFFRLFLSYSQVRSISSPGAFRARGLQCFLTERGTHPRLTYDAADR